MHKQRKGRQDAMIPMSAKEERMAYWVPPWAEGSYASGCKQEQKDTVAGYQAAFAFGATAESFP
jgi:hypothetical protein